MEYIKDLKGLENFKGYKVSKDGKVYSCKSNKFLKITKTKGGYSKVDLYNNGKRKTVYVHRLVLKAFGKYPSDYTNEKYEVNHLDFNKSNNNINNLEWVTHYENMKHNEFKSCNRKVV